VMSYTDLENKQILVVEDDDLSYLYLSQILMTTKGIITREISGIGAIEQFRSGKRFDLVLMDIQLPDIDGKQVTGKIRMLNRTVPIIAQTAGKSSSERDLAIEAGCTDLITKPYTMDELLEVIGKYLQK
jgi:CheY-like chemotaxis protein